MYSCDQDHTSTATRTAALSTRYQPCVAAGRTLQTTAGQVSAEVQLAERRPRRRHAARGPSSSSRRSCTTVVATDVSNFRAMVQELTGFPPAAIFRPLPRRVHAASSPLAAVHACGGGGAAHGHSSDAATTAGNSSPDAPTAQSLMMHPPQCATPGLFDGLPDIGSPVIDSWPDLSFE